jgi:hypothetical protein
MLGKKGSFAAVLIVWRAGLTVIFHIQNILDCGGSCPLFPGMKSENLASNYSGTPYSVSKERLVEERSVQNVHIMSLLCRKHLCHP